MLVIQKDYQFNHKDIGKKVMTHNGTIAHIMSIINESGELCMMYGKDDKSGEVIKWNNYGHNEENAGLNITAIWDRK